MHCQQVQAYPIFRDDKLNMTEIQLIDQRRRHRSRCSCELDDTLRAAGIEMGFVEMKDPVKEND